MWRFCEPLENQNLTPFCFVFLLDSDLPPPVAGWSRLVKKNQHARVTSCLLSVAKERLPGIVRAMRTSQICISLIVFLTITLLGHAAPSESGKRLGENPIIRAMIVDDASTIGVTLNADYRLSSLNGNLAQSVRKGVVLAFRPLAGAVVLESPETTGSAQGPGFVLEPLAESGRLALTGWSSGSSSRVYSDRLEIRVSKNSKLVAINSLPLEQYLRGVVPSEIGGNTPHQAQCAQAVAARSEAALALLTGKYSGPHYDICSTVQCQVFSGMTATTDAADSAISATRGLILMYDGKPLSAFYAALCGGHTEALQNVWPERGSGNQAYRDATVFDGENLNLDLTTEDGFRKYLDTNRDSWCNPQRQKVPEWAGRNFQWTRAFTPADLAKLPRLKDAGAIREIKVLKRGVSGRIIEMQLAGDRGAQTISSQAAIRTAFTPPLKSSAFLIEQSGTGENLTFTFRGTGSGHGVGMCQTGAMGMANAGKDFREILKHYYPKATVEKAY